MLCHRFVMTIAAGHARGCSPDRRILTILPTQAHSSLSVLLHLSAERTLASGSLTLLQRLVENFCGGSASLLFTRQHRHEINFMSTPSANVEIHPNDFCFTGPETLAGAYMRMFWHPVALSADLHSGQAKPLTVMSEEVTIYRGTSGKAHALAGRCVHRSALLHIGFVEDEDLRCMYHGWRFDSKGRCVEIPGSVDTQAKNISVRAYPTEEYLGLIFIYMGPQDPPPIFPRYPDFEEPGVTETRCNLRPCNYFQDVENNVDPAHTPFTHAISSYMDSGLTSVPVVQGEETSWGIAQYSGRPEGTRVSHHGMPTMLNLKFQPESEGGWKDFMAWRVPITDDSHMNFLVIHARVTGEAAERLKAAIAQRYEVVSGLPSVIEVANAVLAGHRRLSDFSDHPDLLFIQDHITQMAQGTITDRCTERLSQSDKLVVLLRRIWAREIRAMAQGQELTQWIRSSDIRPTTGIERLGKKQSA